MYIASGSKPKKPGFRKTILGVGAITAVVYLTWRGCTVIDDKIVEKTTEYNENRRLRSDDKAAKKAEALERYNAKKAEDRAAKSASAPSAAMRRAA